MSGTIGSRREAEFERLFTNEQMDLSTPAKMVYSLSAVFKNELSFDSFSDPICGDAGKQLTRNTNEPMAINHHKVCMLYVDYLIKYLFLTNFKMLLQSLMLIQ